MTDPIRGKEPSGDLVSRAEMDAKVQKVKDRANTLFAAKTMELETRIAELEVRLAERAIAPVTPPSSSEGSPKRVSPVSFVGPPPPPPPPPPPAPMLSAVVMSDLQNKYLGIAPALSGEERLEGAEHSKDVGSLSQEVWVPYTRAVYAVVKKQKPQAEAAKETCEGLLEKQKDLVKMTEKLLTCLVRIERAQLAQKTGANLSIATRNKKGVELELLFYPKGVAPKAVPEGTVVASDIETFIKQTRTLGMEAVKELKTDAQKMPAHVAALAMQMKPYAMALPAVKAALKQLHTETERLAADVEGAAASREAAVAFQTSAQALQTSIAAASHYQQHYAQLLAKKEAALFQFRSKAGLVEKSGELVVKGREAAAQPASRQAATAGTLDPMSQAAITTNPARYVDEYGL